jgi:hypothetical protein
MLFGGCGAVPRCMRWIIQRQCDTEKETLSITIIMILTTMKLAIFCLVLASVATLSLSAPLSLDDSLL